MFYIGSRCVNISALQSGAGALLVFLFKRPDYIYTSGNTKKNRNVNINSSRNISFGNKLRAQSDSIFISYVIKGWGWF